MSAHISLIAASCAATGGLASAAAAPGGRCWSLRQAEARLRCPPRACHRIMSRDLHAARAVRT
eukprot:15462685-Alexandrium_andersonii.AAC.1